MKEHEQEKVVSFQIKCTFLVIRLCWNSVCSKLSTWLGLTLPFEKQIYFMRNKHTHTQAQSYCSWLVPNTKGTMQSTKIHLHINWLYAAFLLATLAWLNNTKQYFLFHFHSSAQQIAYILPTILLDWFAVANANIGVGTDTRCRCKTS